MVNVLSIQVLGNFAHPEDWWMLKPNLPFFYKIQMHIKRMLSELIYCDKPSVSFLAFNSKHLQVRYALLFQVIKISPWNYANNTSFSKFVVIAVTESSLQI